MTDQPIRVLQVFSQTNIGGAETFIMNLYYEIDKTKVQFDFIVHDKKKGDYDSEIAKLGGRIYRMPKFYGFNLFSYIYAWYSFFYKHNCYKIIHSHIRITAPIFLYIAKKFGLATIAHSHSTSSGKGLKAMLKNILILPIKYIAEYKIACSRKSGEWLFGRKFNRSQKCIILNNSIDTKKFQFSHNDRKRVRHYLKISEKFVLGHIGRFEPPKNHIFILKVFKEICKKEDNAILLLIGVGTLMNKIHELVNDMRLNAKVIFYGKTKKIPDFLSAMDYFIFPSLFEGFPMVLIEAQTSGLPIIISNKITNDVRITKLILNESLDVSPCFWADRILSYNKFYDRSIALNEVVNSGYDIKKTSKKLERFYINLFNTTFNNA